MKTRIAEDGTIDGGWTIADQSINERYHCSSAYETEAEAKASKANLIAPYIWQAEIRLVNVRYSHVDNNGKVTYSTGQRYAILEPKDYQS